MKATLAILTVLGLTGLTLANSIPSQNVATSSLCQDLKDFKNLIPVKKMINLAHEYYVHDPEFKKAVDYIYSSEFKELTEKIKASPAVAEVKSYLKKKGFDARELVASQLRSMPQMKITGGGFAGFFQDLQALIPVNEIKSLYDKKLVTSKKFALLIEIITSPELKSLTNKIRLDPTVQQAVKKLKSFDFDLHTVMEYLNSNFGRVFKGLF